MPLPEFQRRLRDCEVVRHPDEDFAAIILLPGMVDAQIAKALSYSKTSRTRVLPDGRVVHGFDLVEMGVQAIDLLTKGNPLQESVQRRIAIFKRICTPEEWAEVETVASAVSTTAA